MDDKGQFWLYWCMGQEASTRHKPAGLRTTRMAVMAVSGLRCVQFASPVQPLMSVISHLRHDPHTQTRGTLFTMKTTRPREVTIPCPPLKSRTDPLLAPRPAARAEEGTPLIHPQRREDSGGPARQEAAGQPQDRTIGAAPIQTQAPQDSGLDLKGLLS